MRFILQDDVYDELPPDWDDLVQEAKEYVEEHVEKAKAAAQKNGVSGSALDDVCLAARHEAINKKASLWAAAGKALRAASHEKCWYCEIDDKRSDKPIDHFRPKNSVAEDKSHPGYTWLAFEWENFRLSCTFCNSRRRDVEGGTLGGKSNHFPVITPPVHARTPNDPKDRPMLLDPVCDEDTMLITFHLNGLAKPAKDDPLTKARVGKSIELYHLDQIGLVRKRKRLAVDIQRHVTMGDDAAAAHDDDTFRYHKKEIIKRARAKAELSSAARVYLTKYRDRRWVEELVTRDL